MVRKEEKARIYLWRKATKKQVWYEWMMEILNEKGFSLVKSKIHNEAGCGSCIYLE
jgi:hypothetical protein